MSSALKARFTRFVRISSSDSSVRSDRWDAISHVNLPAFNAQFIGSEILTQDIVQYTFHLFLRQEVNGRNSKQISVFIHKNTNLRTPFMKRPRIVTVPRKDRVNSHFGNGLFAEHTQRRLFTLCKNFFRQLSPQEGQNSSSSDISSSQLSHYTWNVLRSTPSTDSKSLRNASTRTPNPILSALVNLLTVTPTTSLFSLKIGPPELPGFTAASVCI